LLECVLAEAVEAKWLAPPISYLEQLLPW
jgi:hypothetical protein